MDAVSKDILTLLNQLLPGLVTAWVIYGLTSHPRPTQFERVVQALIYSFFIGALVAFEEKALLFAGRFYAFGYWDKSAELFASSLSALGLGLIISFFSNNDTFYKFARDKGFTTRTAFPSEWYGAFSQHPRYTVLHLRGGRRISGYPVDWPSEPTAGHFRLVDAAWVNEDRTETVLDGDHSILIPAAEVELVELLKYREELPNGTKAAEPVPTATVTVAPKREHWCESLD